MQECSQQHVELVDDELTEEFSEEQRERLARLRRAIGRGERTETYPLNKYQDFVRWLIDQGKLSEN